MRTLGHVYSCPIVGVFCAYLAGVVGVGILNVGHSAAPNWASFLMVLSVGLAVFLLSKRGSPVEEPAGIWRSLGAGGAASVSVLVGLVGFRSSGDQRGLFLGLVALFGVSLLAFATLHVINWQEEAGERRAVPFVMMGAGALARLPVAILWSIGLVLLLAVLWIFITGKALDLSWLF
jgi:multidrug transporter EmrE-like cation transporter